MRNKLPLNEDSLALWLDKGILHPKSILQANPIMVLRLT